MSKENANPNGPKWISGGLGKAIFDGQSLSSFLEIGKGPKEAKSCSDIVRISIKTQ